MPVVGNGDGHRVEIRALVKIPEIFVHRAIRVVVFLVRDVLGLFQVLFIDINSLSFTSFNIVNRENCPTCGTPAIEVKPPVSEPKVVELCGKDSFMASPKQPLTLNLAEVADLLKEQFKIKLRSSFGLSLEQSDGVSISLMKTGNALIKGVSDKKDAISIYDKLLTVLKTTGL